MAEPTWNGSLRVYLVSCPVFLAPATSDRKWVRLEPLNSRTGHPVAPGFIDARTGDAVRPEAVVQAHQFENGRFVQISDAELRDLAGPVSQVIDIDEFIPQGTFDRLFFESSHYVYPDGPLAGDTLYTWRTAMQRKGKMGLGRMYMGGRERRVLVEPRDAGLMLTILRDAQQLEDVEFESRTETDIPIQLLELAEWTVDRHSANVDPNSLRDAYHAALRELVEGKVSTARGGGSTAQTASYSGAAAATAFARAPEPEPPPPPAPAPEPTPAFYTREPEPAPEPVHEPEPVVAAPEPVHEPPPIVAAPEPAPVAYEPEPEPELELAPEPELEPAAAAYEPEPPPVQAPAAAIEEPPLPQAAAAAESAVAAMAEEPGADREVGSEIFLHIIGLGERRFVGSGWAGTPGSRQPIEALSIRPAESLPRSAIEFRVFARDGRATSWVTDGNYAGSWGRRLPLTGFAVRPTEGHGGDVEIVYEGYFSEGGVVGPKRDGEVCTSAIADDPLEAVLVRILGRAA